ncbi:hypothetical protein MHHB_P0805 [Methanofervidicoccus abyssi]|uniref:Uncharacterized protein n=1 Tax=Methanofervidicoccus abyssi TaxID=2082189 RepID=A0A401HQT9_9EURY|nr:hypothetical protein MHHB_P0805 [Methanofervidicoccus abyssi]
MLYVRGLIVKDPFATMIVRGEKTWKIYSFLQSSITGGYQQDEKGNSKILIFNKSK